LNSIFRELCVMPCEPDGLIFDPDSVSVGPIREGQAYGGLQVKLQAGLEQAKIPLQVDVGFGDAVVPRPAETTYPTILDFPPPRLRIYSGETVIAEKLHAMVMLGMLNSRMKDFYDLWTLRNAFAFDGAVLQKAIETTFTHRKTPIPDEIPIAMTGEFSSDARKNQQWQAFLRRNRLMPDDILLPQIVDELHDFLVPVLHALQQGIQFDRHWPAGGPWSDNK